MAGLEDSPIRDIRLSDIRIVIPIAATAEAFKQFPSEPPENIKGYPENRLTFGFRLPAAAFYVRHVEGIKMTDIAVTQPQPEARPAFYFDDVRGIALRGVRVNDRPIEENSSRIRRKNSTEVEFPK